MTATRPGATLLWLSLSLCALLRAPVPARAQSPWEFGLSTGYAPPFTAEKHVYSFATYSDVLGGAPFFSAAVRRTVLPRLQLITGTAFVQFEREQQLFFAYAAYESLGPGRVRLEANFVPLWTGVRFTPISGADGANRLYVEAAPAVIWTRWKSIMTAPQYPPYLFARLAPGEYGDADSFHRFLPGLVLGAGLEHTIGEGVSFAMGFRGLWSGKVGRRRLEGNLAGDYEGLRQLVYEVGLSWTP